LVTVVFGAVQQQQQQQQKAFVNLQSKPNATLPLQIKTLGTDSGGVFKGKRDDNDTADVIITPLATQLAHCWPVCNFAVAASDVSYTPLHPCRSRHWARTEHHTTHSTVCVIHPTPPLQIKTLGTDSGGVYKGKRDDNNTAYVITTPFEVVQQQGEGEAAEVTHTGTKGRSLAIGEYALAADNPRRLVIKFKSECSSSRHSELLLVLSCAVAMAAAAALVADNHSG
jgi:hypothetical protein